MAIKKLTGKASTITVAGTPISMTKYTPKITRTLAKSQGSDNYDPVDDMLQPENLPVGVEMELSVEGKYDLLLTPTLVVEKMFTGGDPVDVVLGLDAGNLFGHGKFDLSDFETGVVIDDNITFTCTLKQHGKFTRGA